MECVLPDNSARFWAIITPFTTLGIVIMLSVALYLIYRKRIVEEWDTMRSNGLKRRYSPTVPTLSCCSCLLIVTMHCDAAVHALKCIMFAAGNGKLQGLATCLIFHETVGWLPLSVGPSFTTLKEW